MGDESVKVPNSNEITSMRERFILISSFLEIKGTVILKAGKPLQNFRLSFRHKVMPMRQVQN